MIAACSRLGDEVSTGAVDWPLTGRQSELDSISWVVRGDDCRGLVLAGAPGVGKTRLLWAVVDQARAGGRTVEMAAATRATASVPFGAVSHLLPTDRSVHAAGAAMFGRVADALRAAPGQAPPLLAVDSAHLLDDASAALVHYLRIRGVASVVLAVCDGEPAPDAIGSLWKDGLARRLDVAPLPDAAIDTLIDHALGGQVSGFTRAQLRRTTGGNPLYLRELLLAATSSGALRRVDGLWQWQGDLPRVGRLSELLEARLRACGSAGRAVVELVACGEPLPLALLETDPGLVAAERANLVEVVEDGKRRTLRLAHPFYGEVLRAALGPAQLRAVHRRLAELLAGTPLRRRDDLLRMTTWQLAAGAPMSAATLAPAAREALARGDLPLAERLARAAADAGAEAGVEVLAEVLYWRGRHDDSVALLTPAGPARTTARPAGSRSLLTMAANLYWGKKRRGDASRALQEARASAPAGDAEVRSVEAMMAMFDGRCRASLALALPVWDDADQPVDARLCAAAAAVVSAALLGRFDEALAHADAGLRLAAERPGGNRMYAAHVALGRGHTLLLSGRLRQARAEADRGYREASADDPGTAAQWAALRGAVARLQGDLDAAVESLRDAVAAAQRQDPAGLLRFHLTTLAGTLAMTGDYASAAERLHRAEARPDPIHRVCAPQVDANRAWVAAAGGEFSRAADLALLAARRAGAAEQPGLEAHLLHDAVRHGRAVQARERLADLAADLRNELISAYAASAAARADGDPQRLEAAAAAFEALGTPLLAAETTSVAHRAWLERGRPQPAAAALERTRRLLRHCPGAATPDLAIGTGGALTRREREIAVLAARKVTSRGIASQLGVSVRTIDNHLARVYIKLGVSGRAQLAGVLAPDDAGPPPEGRRHEVTAHAMLAIAHEPRRRGRV